MTDQYNNTQKDESIFKPIFRFFKSIKLAVILIIYLALSSGLSTLVPQGKEISFYTQNYSSMLSWLIVKTGFYNLFKTGYFLIPLGIFFINLTTCTVDRFVRNLKRKARRFGPDILHIGLILLVIASLIGIFGRKESLQYLTEGKTLQLDDHYSIKLIKYEFQKYEDGRPKDLLSTVEVKKDGKLLKTYTIEVNKPLKIDKYKIYQSTYYEEQTATLVDLTGQEYTINPGDYYIADNSIVLFRGVKLKKGTEFKQNDTCCPMEGWAIFEQLNIAEGGHSVEKVYRIGVSDTIHGFKVSRICITNYTGLQVVIDPSTTPVIISLSLIGFGISLTFIQKLGEKKL